MNKEIVEQVSWNWACSINATYEYDLKDYTYDYEAAYKTDGQKTELLHTNKFLGNYGIQPLKVTPAVTPSTNVILVDLSDYLDTTDFEINKSDETDYDWYFFTPKLLENSTGSVSLSGIMFYVSYNPELEQFVLRNRTRTENIKSIVITLTYLEGGFYATDS